MSEMTDVVQQLDTLVDTAMGSSPEQSQAPKAETTEQPVETNESEDKQTQTQEAEATTTEKDVEAEKTKTIPYERFKEVNDNYKVTKERIEQIEKQYAEKIKILEDKLSQVPENLTPEQQEVKNAIKTLEEQGFAKKEEIIKEWESKLQREKQQAQEEKKLEVELTQLESKYSGKDGNVKFDRKEVIDFMADNKLHNLSIEQAFFLLHQNDIIDFKIKSALRKNIGVSSVTSDGSGASMNDLNTVKQKMLKGDKKATSDFLDALIK
jgi:hypothetical protein